MLRDRDENGEGSDDVEEKEVNMENFMTLDSVGDVDGLSEGNRTLFNCLIFYSLLVDSFRDEQYSRFSEMASLSSKRYTH